MADLATRFWAKVDRRGPDECWPWLGSVRHPAPRDYGFIWDAGRSRSAHVVAWELEHGEPFPVGAMGCHTCDTPNCVNPAHVFPGTMSDNIRDAVSKGRIRFASNGEVIRPGECSHGHVMDAQNTYVNPSGDRMCRQCRSATDRGRPASYYRTYRADHPDYRERDNARRAQREAVND